MTARDWLIIKNSIAGLPFSSRWPTDEKRFALFGIESAQKVVQLVSAGDISTLTQFLIAERKLSMAWLSRGFKFQFPKDLWSDPFHDLRNETRDFAKQWMFSDDFIALMGPNN